MKNQQLFDKSVSILVNSYHKGTLQHGNACGCGIGNLIAGNLQIPIIENSRFNIWRNDSRKYIWASGEPEWIYVHVIGIMKTPSEENGYQRGLIQIAATGYTPEESCSLEFAFERGCRGRADIDGFNGLMAMVDRLTQIHDGGNRDTHEAKNRFNEVRANKYGSSYRNRPFTNETRGYMDEVPQRNYVDSIPQPRYDPTGRIKPRDYERMYQQYITPQENMERQRLSTQSMVHVGRRVHEEIEILMNQHITSQEQQLSPFDWDQAMGIMVPETPVRERVNVNSETRERRTMRDMGFFV